MTMRSVGPNGNHWKRTYAAEGGALTKGFCVMQGAADNGCKTPTGAGVIVLGVVEDSTVNVGDAVSVIGLGETIAIAGAAIAAGAYVKVLASGKLTPVTGTAGGGENIVGRAVSSASVDGDEFVLFVSPSVL